jgi:hypothetical protein
MIPHIGNGRDDDRLFQVGPTDYASLRSGVNRVYPVAPPRNLTPNTVPTATSSSTSVTLPLTVSISEHLDLSPLNVLTGSPAIHQTFQAAHGSLSRSFAAAISVLHAITPARPVLSGRKTGPVLFVEKLLSAWKLSLEQGASLLGFDDARSLSHLLAGLTTLKGRDAKDRVRHLFEIREALFKLFGGDESAERYWLREPASLLGNKAPLDLLVDGSMENLLRTKQYVEYVAGR